MSLGEYSTGGTSACEGLGALGAGISLPHQFAVESDMTALCEWVRRLLGRECGWTCSRPGVLTVVVQGTVWEREAVRAIIEADVPVGAVVDVVCVGRGVVVS